MDTKWGELFGRGGVFNERDGGNIEHPTSNAEHREGGKRLTTKYAKDTKREDWQHGGEEARTTTRTTTGTRAITRGAAGLP